MTQRGIREQRVRMECGQPTEKDKQANQSTDYKQLLTLCTVLMPTCIARVSINIANTKTHQYVLFVCKAINQQSEQFTIG